MDDLLQNAMTRLRVKVPVKLPVQVDSHSRPNAVTADVMLRLSRRAGLDDWGLPAGGEVVWSRHLFRDTGQSRTSQPRKDQTHRPIGVRPRTLTLAAP